MLIGKFLHKVDEKGRTIIPQKFRDELGTSIVLAEEKNGSILVYSKEEYHRISDKLFEDPFPGKEQEEFRDSLFEESAECEIDKQGRILIPTSFREYAKVEKEVYIVGYMKNLKIWDKNTFDLKKSEKNKQN